MHHHGLKVCCIDVQSKIGADRPLISQATRDNIRNYYSVPQDQKNPPDVVEDYRELQPSEDSSAADPYSSDQNSQRLQNSPLAQQVEPNQPNYYSEDTEQSSATNPHLEPELDHHDTESSYSDITSQDNHIEGEHARHRQPEQHYSKNHPYQQPVFSREHPSQPADRNYEFPPRQHRHPFVTRTSGPVHSMSQIPTVPAIPSDTSLFSPPASDHESESQGSSINFHDKEELETPSHLPSKRNQYSQTTASSHTNSYRRLGPHRPKFRKNEAVNGESARQAHANDNMANSSTIYNISGHIASSTPHSRPPGKQQESTESGTAAEETQAYITKKDLEAFIGGMTDSIAKKIAHTGALEQNENDEKYPSIYISPIHNGTPATGSDENQYYGKITSPHLSMTESRPSSQPEASEPTLPLAKTPEPSASGNNANIEAYLMSFPEGAAILKAYLRGRPPSSKSQSKTEPTAHSTPIQENLDTISVGVTPSKPGKDASSTPQPTDDRKASGVTFACNDNIIPPAESTKNYSTKTVNAGRNSSHLSASDEDSLYERILFLETENSRLGKKLQKTQELLAAKSRQHDNDNIKSSLRIGELESKVESLQDMTVKSSNTTLAKQVAELNVQLDIKDAEIKALLGPARPLVPREMPDYKPDAKTPSLLYQRLNMPLVDTLGVIEARNFIKNIILQTGVNLYRLENKIAGLISCVCLTDMYIQFVNSLNLALFKIPIDLNAYPFGEDRQKTMSQILHEVNNLVLHYKNTKARGL